MRPSVLVMVGLLVTASRGLAQDSVSPPGVKSTTVTVPAGTTLFARLERSVSTRSAKPGDHVYLQIAHPVVVKNEVVIPAGTYVEATLDTIVGHGWINRGLELRLHVARLVFANGYVVAASEPVHGAPVPGSVRSDGQDASAASVTSVAAPVAGIAIGALSDGTRGAEVGGGIGSAIGAVAAIIAMTGGNFVMDAGSTLDLVIQNPLTLDDKRATAPGSSSIATNVLPRAEEPSERRCYSPGAPGTPDIIIPGTPDTPAMGDIPGTPGTPSVTVPGTPETAGYWHRCN